jgi:hypothetical protein
MEAYMADAKKKAPAKKSTAKKSTASKATSKAATKKVAAPAAPAAPKPDPAIALRKEIAVLAEAKAAAERKMLGAAANDHIKAREADIAAVQPELDAARSAHAEAVKKLYDMKVKAGSVR